MTVTNILKDAESLTMTINATFDAPVERVWQVWNDPRQLERVFPAPPAGVVSRAPPRRESAMRTRPARRS